MIEPQKGGLISNLRWRDTELFYSPQTRPQAPNGIHLYGCWPLVPFANRAFEGMVRFNNTAIQLKFNDETSTMHGFGWQKMWNIISQTHNRITLIHESCNECLPFIYEAKQFIELHENGAKISLEVENLSDKPLPYGIGFHPWFNCNDTTLFNAKADARMDLTEEYRPIGIFQLDTSSNFSYPKHVKTGQEIAINYLGWDGKAQLDYFDYSIQITASETLRTPVFWTPKNADFVCFEPQSHASGAPSEPIAQKYAPMRILKKNETLKGWMTIGATIG